MMATYLHVAFECDPEAMRVLHDFVEPLVGTRHVRVLKSPESIPCDNVVAWVTRPELFSRGLANRAFFEFVDNGCSLTYVNERISELNS